MRRPDSYQFFGHATDDRVILWVYGRTGKLEMFVGIGADDHDAQWDMSVVLAFGRVRGKDGSLVVEFRNSARQRRLADALVDRFPGVKFWVWGHGWHGAKSIQEWWNHISGEHFDSKRSYRQGYKSYPQADMERLR